MMHFGEHWKAFVQMDKEKSYLRAPLTHMHLRWVGGGLDFWQNYWGADSLIINPQYVKTPTNGGIGL